MAQNSNNNTDTNNNNHSGGVVVVVSSSSATSAARMVAGARRKGRSGARRPIFGHRSLQQKQCMAGKKSSSSSTAKTFSSSEHNKNWSPVSVLEEQEPQVSVVEHRYDETKVVESTSRQVTTTVTASNNNLLSPVTLPAVAWQVHQSLLDEVNRRRFIMSLLHSAIIVASAAGLSAAVLYAHYYAGLTKNGFPPLDNTPAMVMFVATIVLPVVVTCLVPQRRKFNERFPLSAAQVALAQWEAAVYKFRTVIVSTTTTTTTTVEEDMNNDTSRHHEREVQRRREQAQALQTKALEIWSSVLPMVVGNRSFPTNGDLWINNFELSTTKDTKETSIEADSKAWPPLYGSSNGDQRTGAQEQQQHSSYRPATQWEQELPCCIIPTTTTALTDAAAAPDQNDCGLHLPFARDLEASRTPTETTPMLLKPKLSSSNSLNKTMVDEEKNKENTAQQQQQERMDDLNSLWTVKEYIQFRLQPILQAKTKRVASLQLWHVILQRTIAMLTVSASMLALVAKQWCIPIILAVAAAGTSTLEASSLVQQLHQQEKCVTALQELWSTCQEGEMVMDEEKGSTLAQCEIVEKVEAVLVEAAG